MAHRFSPRSRAGARDLALRGAVALVVAGSLAGCGDDGDTPTEPRAHVEALDLGATADIAYFPDSGGTEPVATGSVTVTAVRTGTVADLTAAGYQLTAEQKDTTPYYVDVRFENDGTTPVAPRRPSGYDEDADDTILALTLIDLNGTSFALCPGIPDEVQPGITALGCAVLLVPTDAHLSHVSYLANASVDDVYWTVE